MTGLGASQAFSAGDNYFLELNKQKEAVLWLLPLWNSSPPNPITDQAACKSLASASSPKHLLSPSTWSLTLL